MIKVLKKGKNNPWQKKINRITCDCGCVFECDDNDTVVRTMGQGMTVKTIYCPHCKTLCYDGQGGCYDWETVLTAE